MRNQKEALIERNRGRTVPEDVLDEQRIKARQRIKTLTINQADVLHRTLERFKTDNRNVHDISHGGSWRDCTNRFCIDNRQIIEEAEVVLYGEVQDD